MFIIYGLVLYYKKQYIQQKTAQTGGSIRKGNCNYFSEKSASVAPLSSPDSGLDSSAFWASWAAL